MAYLIDMSILGRLSNTSDSQSAVATNAVLELHSRGETLHVAPQVMIEFRNLATRPVQVNGLGLSIEDAETLAPHSRRGFHSYRILPQFILHGKSSSMASA
jgi:hypothetical protein